VAKKLIVKDRERCIGCYSCMFACTRTWHGAVGIEKSAMRVKNYPGVEGAFSVRVCQACKDPECAAACPTGALRVSKRGFGVELVKELCRHCRKCIKACAANALQWDEQEQVPIVCHHCGVCVRYCPTEVLAMEEVG